MSENEGEFKKQIDEKTVHPAGIKNFGSWILIENLDKIIEDVEKEFYTVWNNAYGSSAQQGIDIYNKWFLKYFGEK